MFIGIDIDQTISTGYRGTSLKDSIAYYQQRGVTLPETVRTYPQLFQLPAVLRMHDVLPGAVAGVTALAHSSRIAYYTVRKHEDRLVEDEIHALTRAWLTDHHFPSSDQVIFCRSVMQKLVKMYEQEKDHPGRLVLIDDRWQMALQAQQQITQQDEYQHIAHMLQQRLTLVAFGATSLPEDNTAISVIPFPDWSYLSDLLPVIEGGKEE